jgi:hypothetical protein
MTQRRLPPPPLSSVPTFVLDATLEALRDELRRADAMLAAVAEKLEELWRDDAGPEVTRWRGHLPYFVEGAQRAIRAAIDGGDQLDLHRKALHRRDA